MDSKDRRTKRQKLKDMANQSASPNEAEVARKKLEEMGPEETDPFYNPPYIMKDMSWNFEIKFTPGEYRPSGEPFKPGPFAEPFRESEGDGLYVYDFKNEKWVKIV